MNNLNKNDGELKMLKERLEAKQEQWNRRYDHLKHMVISESATNTFESNSVVILLDMQKLKSEIKELKFYIEQLDDR